MQNIVDALTEMRIRQLYSIKSIKKLFNSIELTSKNTKLIAAP